MKLLYLANARIPTEKAHGLQIMQNCEAFAMQGARVTLWAAARINAPEFRQVTDPWQYYGINRNFELRRIPSLDLQLWVSNDVYLLRKGTFLLQTVTYLLILLVGLLFARADVYYSRDLMTILLLSLLKSRNAIAYEPHRLAKSRLGHWLQTMAVRRAGHLFPVTPPMAQQLIERGADPSRTHPAHDGIRRERFAHLPDQHTARQEIGWSEDAFIVGYVGRLHTMSMDKGVGLLLQAIAQVEGLSLALVGGPDDMAAQLRQQWLKAGLRAKDFLYAGQVAPVDVPRYQSAFDVCVMPFPWTEHFAYYASPIKLFEYMASGRVIVASELPAYADVVQHGISALLVPPGDVTALAAALKQLRDDTTLRERLALCARQRVLEQYTWTARAEMILGKIADNRQLMAPSQSQRRGDASPEER